MHCSFLVFSVEFLCAMHTGVRTHFSLLQHWESNQSSAPDGVLTYRYASAAVLKHVWVVLH